jgi:integrase
MGRTPSRNRNMPPQMRARHRGAKTYYFFDTGLKPRKEISLGTDYALAVKKWAELRGNVTPREVAAVLTFRVVAEEYQRKVIPTKAARTQKDNEIELTKLLEFFDDAPFEAIRPIHIRQYMTWRQEDAIARIEKKNVERRAAGKTELAPGEGKVRANREKALFSHIWNMAREWGYTDLPNPCAGVKGHTEYGRSNYTEEDVYAAVWEAANQPLRDAMDLAYSTGQRPADTLKMQETDIRDGMIDVEQGKTGAKIRMLIEGELKVVIDRIMQTKRAHKVRSLALICNEKGAALSHSALRQRLVHARERAAKAHPHLAAAIASFQFRDLRAKAGTDKADSSGDIRQAQKQLGHSSVTMTETYVRKRRGEVVKPTR